MEAATAQRKPSYRLPDGMYTDDPAAMAIAWQEFARPIGELLGAELCGFVPGVSWSLKDGTYLRLDTWFILAVNAVIAQRDKLLAIVKDLQWSAPMRGGGNGTCPECVADADCDGGHESDCPIGKVLRKATEAEQ